MVLMDKKPSRGNVTGGPGRRRFFLFCVFLVLILFRLGFAADKGLEFGIEDDLTVNGTEGTKTDADLEVKGYSVFGSGSGAAKVTSGEGSLYIQNNLELGGNSYFWGNIGIGTAEPTSKLQIAGDVTNYPTTGTYGQLEVTGSSNPAQRLSLGVQTTASVGFIQYLVNGDNYYSLALNPLGGKVGIGTTAPGQKLSVAGTIETTVGGIKFPDTTIQTTAMSGSNYVLKTGDTMTGTLTIGANSGLTVDTNTLFVDTANHRIGIGTTSPTGRLDVSAGLASQTAGDLVVDTANNTVYIGKLDSVSGNTTLIFRDRLGNIKSQWNNAGSGNIKFPSFNSGYGVGIGDGITDAQTTATLNVKGNTSASNYNALNVMNSGATSLFLVRNDGNVGIGTTSPSSPLTVAGTIETTAGGIKFPDTTIQTTAMSGSNYVLKAGDTMTGTLTNTAGAYFATSTGSVGVGTATPGTPLEVRSDSEGSKIDLLTIKNYGTSADTGGSIIFRNVFRNARITSYSTPGSAYGGNLQLQTHGGANDNDTPSDWNAGIFMDNGGLVGIGTTAPDTRTEIFYVPDLNSTVDDVLKVTSKFDASGGGASAAAGSGPAILFSGGIGDNQERNRARIVAVYEGSNVSGLSFHTQDLADSITEKVRIRATTGNVGIGTTAPGQKLTVAGTIETTVGGIKFPDTTIQTTAMSGSNYVLKAGDTMTGTLSIDAGTLDTALRIRTDSNTREALYVSKAGNVGIGTTAPTQKLEVAGNILLSSSGATIYGPSGTYYQHFDASVGNLYCFALNRSGGSVGAPDFFGGSGGLVLGATIGGTGIISLNTTGNVTPTMYLTSTGSVGVGTAAPLGKLDIRGATYFENGKIDGTWGDQMFFGAAPDNYPSTYLHKIKTSHSGTPSVGGMVFSLNDGTPTGYTDVLTLKEDGKVGIGTTEPSSKLTVAGIVELTAGGIKFPDTTIQTTAANTANYVLKAGDTMTGTLTNTAGANLATSSGYVGIGTASPGTILTVNQPGDSNGIRLTETGGTVGLNANLEIVNGASTPYLNMRVQDNGFYRNIVLAGDGGNVGIGSSEPGAKLDVNGNIHTKGHVILDPNNYFLFGTGWGVTNTSSNGNWDVVYGTPKLSVTTVGNVGIGTTTPGQKLTVAGTIETTVGGIKFPDSTILTSATGNYVLKAGDTMTGTLTNTAGANLATSSGSVGIGTAAPGTGTYADTKLHVYGTNIKGTSLTLENNGSTAYLGTELLLKSASIHRGNGVIFTNTENKQTFGFGTPYETPGALQIGYVADYSAEGLSPFAETSALDAGHGLMTILSTGYIGIGTASPASLLQVGAANSTGGTSTAKIATDVGADGTVVNALRIDTDGADWNFNRGVAISLGYETTHAYTSRLVHYGDENSVYGSKLQLQTHSNTIDVWNTGLVMDNAGNVGIGTAEPGTYLDGTSGLAVYNATLPGISWGNDTSHWTSYMSGSNLQFYNGAAGSLLTLTTTSNVGIGTTAPGQKLSVAGTIEMTSGSGGGLKFPDGTIQTSAVNGNYVLKAGDTMTGTLTNTAGANLATSTGSVGVGTATPSYKLDVQGTAGFNTAIYGNGKAVAETADTYLRLNQSNQFSDGIWLGTSNLWNKQPKDV
ncbi:MAG: hypothetical protein WC749_04825 [Dehalococcoidia bacterium]